MNFGGSSALALQPHQNQAPVLRRRKGTPAPQPLPVVKELPTSEDPLRLTVHAAEFVDTSPREPVLVRRHADSGRRACARLKQVPPSCGPLERHPDLPDPTTFLHTITSALLEVQAGRRAPSTVAVHLHRHVAIQMARQAAQASRRKPRQAVSRLRPTRVRSTHVQYPAPDVAECSMTVSVGGITRVAAARLEATAAGRWIVTYFTTL